MVRLGLYLLIKNKLSSLTFGFDAEPHQKKGYAFRPGWHCCEKPEAPHLYGKPHERQWWVVEIKDYTKFERPENQGGTWYIANKIKFLNPLGE